MKSKTAILNLSEIKRIVAELDHIAAIEKGFIEYSNGNSVVPPVGELIFDKPKGEAHIKYGYIKGQDYYCIKVASGFYDNPKLGIPSNQGLMLLFSQNTGEVKAVLLDEGYLTDLRTGAAGAVAAKYFAPKNINSVGIIGTGVQAQFQLDFARKVRSFDNVLVWGRNINHAEQFKQFNLGNYQIEVAESPTEIAQTCNLIITTTPSDKPLLWARNIKPGTHITAMGSDTDFKQELDGEILKIADLVIADSIPQSQNRGEIFQAVKQGMILQNKVIELGTAIQNPNLIRNDDTQISVVDLTGVAVQDIMIASAVYQKFLVK